MDRALQVQALELAREHIARGEQSLATQRRVVAELERDGHDAGLARQLLSRFEILQAEHAAHRDRLERELAVQKNW